MGSARRKPGLTKKKSVEYLGKSYSLGDRILWVGCHDSGPVTPIEGVLQEIIESPDRLYLVILEAGHKRLVRAG